MKRMLALLGLLVLLTGCTVVPKPTTSPTTTGSTEPTVSLYDPTSDIEEDTNGAVRAYPMTGHDVQGFRFMGQDMILFTKDDHVELTTLHLLRGDTLRVVRSLTLDLGLYPDDAHLRITGDSLGYYNQAENSIVILDASLNETRRIRLPDDVTEGPVLNSDLSLLYYASGNELRELDLSNGISRLIKQHSCESQSIVGLHFGDTMLEVYLTEADGTGRVEFVDTGDGQTVGEDPNLLQIETQGTAFLLERMDGTVRELLAGKKDGQLQLLRPEKTDVLAQALSVNGVLAGGGSSLALYDLASGKISSRIDLGSDVQITDAAVDPTGNYVWIHGFDSVLGTDAVYRWDVVATESAGSTVYLTDRFTADAPDTQGIDALQQKAEALKEKYGFQIRLNEEVPQPEGYEFVFEYQTEAIDLALTQLETVLAKYPEGFLSGLSSVSKNGVVYVGLVRELKDIAGTPVPDGQGLHYMLSGDHHIALQLGGDLESCIHHQICHVLDSKVYSVSKAFDLWDDLNPEGFAYLGTYRDVEVDPDDPNLQGDTRAFADAYSMTFVKEDRARLFEYAVAEGNADLFASPIMQAKLKQLSQGIREAYKWKDTDLPLPWEQYILPAE